MIRIAYTVAVKRLLPFLFTIIIAVFAGFFIANYQTQSRILQLLTSPATTDQLRGIELIKESTFDELVPLLEPILKNNSDASEVAQRLLVKHAFQENRIPDLEGISIDSELYESALWWNNERDNQTLPLDIDINPSPWIEKLLAWYPSMHKETTYHDLVSLPVRDRDGSVVLSVLAINKLASQKTETLIQEWEKDYDLERQKAAVLLSAIQGLPTLDIATQNESLATIQKIINENNYKLAWRALHKSDGTIDPDIALAAMIIDQERFMPILIETAQCDQWAYPEHAIIIVNAFSNDIANQIPFDLLKNDKTRQKWWTLFACGLLQEER